MSPGLAGLTPVTGEMILDFIAERDLGLSRDTGKDARTGRLVSIRTDTAPTALRPVLAAYGYTLAAACYAWCLVQRVTLKIEIRGAEHVETQRGYIFCHWHGAIPLMLQCSVPRMPGVLRGRPHAWMQHPLWYMKTVHVFIRLIGVRRIVLGSTGHDGRKAADELAALLRAGYSTFVFPDGPAGPRQTLHRGVLHLSAQTGVPIVPIRLDASRAISARTWDRKQVPLPFSTIRMSIGRAIVVEPGRLEQAAQRLLMALGRDPSAAR